MSSFITSSSLHTVLFFFFLRESQSGGSITPPAACLWITFIPEAGWAKIITKNCYEQLFICLPFCPWLLDYHFSLLRLWIYRTKGWWKKIFLPLKRYHTKGGFNIETCLFSCTLSLCVSVCIWFACLFYALCVCVCVCVRRPPQMNVISYCNGAC